MTAAPIVVLLWLAASPTAGWDTLAHDVRNATVLKHAGRLMGMELRDALRWGVDELERQGQLACEGDWLVNRDP